MSKLRNGYCHCRLHSVLHCSCSGLSSCSIVKRHAKSTNPKSSCLHGFHGLHVATFLAERSAMEQCNRNRGRLTWALTPLKIPKDHQKQKSPRLHSELDRRNGAPTGVKHTNCRFPQVAAFVAVSHTDHHEPTHSIIVSVAALWIRSIQFGIAGQRC